MKILVTGGAGYVGSHTAIEMLAAGHELVLLDNLGNSSLAAVDAVRSIANRDVPFVQCDIRDQQGLDEVFATNDFDAVMHFAALKAVGESVERPLAYYDNNVTGSQRLLDRMLAHGVKTLVFSSSASVYGDAGKLPVSEDAPTAPESPYARTKFVVEHMLREVHLAHPDTRISILRYFNAVGAHPSGRIGEQPTGTPNNLLPYLAEVAAGRRPRLNLFGDDYPTPDGTCIRDYLHVVDLAVGHVKALDHLQAAPGLTVHNLGTGRGHSVLEVLHAFESACGRTLPYQVVARRAGDVAVSLADASRARDELGWTAERDLRTVCEDLWRWQSSIR